MVDELTLAERDLMGEIEQAPSDPKNAAFQKLAAAAKEIDVRKLEPGMTVVVYTPYTRTCTVEKKQGLSALVKVESGGAAWHEVWAIRPCQYRNKKTGTIDKFDRLVVVQDSRPEPLQQSSPLVARDPKNQQPWRFEMSVVEGTIQETPSVRAEVEPQADRKPGLAKAKGSS